MTLSEKSLVLAHFVLVNTSRRVDSLDSAEARAKIAMYATENGNSKAAQHFRKLLGRNINESTVQGIKSSYSEHGCLETSVDALCMELPQSPRGRPVKIGKITCPCPFCTRKYEQTSGFFGLCRS